jgi:mono/diheme cytochrome c family protein
MTRSIRTSMAIAGLAFAAACTAPPPPAPAASAQPPKPTPAERGAYLVAANGCNDCHTPMKMGANGPEPDMSRMLSGHPEGTTLTQPPKLEGTWMAAAASTFTSWYGPWGISFTANLTPDQLTGLGIWTEEMFVRAIREGKHMGQSRPILPPMPWPAFKNYSDDDLKAIFAYLRTIPPIVNHVPEPMPPDEVARTKFPYVPKVK